MNIEALKKYNQEIILEHNKILYEYKKINNIDHKIKNIIEKLLKFDELQSNKYFIKFGFIQGYLYTKKELSSNLKLEEEKNNSYFKSMIEKYFSQGLEQKEMYDYGKIYINENIDLLSQYNKYNIENNAIKDLFLLLKINNENFIFEQHSKWLGFFLAYLLYSNTIKNDEEKDALEQLFFH